MRSKEDIFKQLGLGEEFRRPGGIVPDLADALIIDALVDIRDIFSQALVALDRIGESLEQLK